MKLTCQIYLNQGSIIRKDIKINRLTRVSRTATQESQDPVPKVEDLKIVDMCRHMYLILIFEFWRERENIEE